MQEGESKPPKDAADIEEALFDRCPALESTEYTCDRPARYLIAGTRYCHVHARRRMEQEATYEENQDVITGVRFVATLDSRTSDICISLDAQRWAVDDPKLRVPGVSTHPGGCRSKLVPVVAYARLGLTPPPEGERGREPFRGRSPRVLE